MPAAPRPSAAPEGRGTLAGKARGTRAAVALLGSRDSLRLLDVDQVALVRVEELVRDARPASELVDLEQLRRGRELRLVDQRGHHRAVALARVDLLRVAGPQEVQERLGIRQLLAVLDHRSRVLDQD